MSTSKTSSTIARSVAGQSWGAPDQQKKLAPGTYWFSTPGHGGIVALVDELDLDESVIEAARKAGLIHYTIRVNHGRRHSVYSTANGYRKEDLVKTAERYPRHTEVREVWVGEEDCDWATLAYVYPALRDGMAKKGFGSVPFEEIQDTVVRYNADFYNEVNA